MHFIRIILVVGFLLYISFSIFGHLKKRSVVCFTAKTGIPLPGFIEFDGMGVDECNLMRFISAQIPSNSNRFFNPTAQTMA